MPLNMKEDSVHVPSADHQINVDLRLASTWGLRMLQIVRHIIFDYNHSFSYFFCLAQWRGGMRP
jgi:hypothetical protein